MRHPILRPDFRWILFVFAGVTLIGALPWFRGLSYFGLDFTRTTLAHLCELKHLLAQHWPLWISPWIGGGEPLFANFEGQVLYPIRWIELLFRPETGGTFGVALHLGFAAAGTYELARGFKFQRFESASAALFFAFCGTTLQLINHANFLAGAAWLPWAWATGRALVRDKHLRLAPLFGFAASVSLLLLGGEPQALVMALGIIAIDALAFSIQAERPSFRRLALTMLAGVAAAMIPAAQWLPALRELDIGAHARGMSHSVRYLWQYEPASWLATVWPGILSENIQHAKDLWSLALRDTVNDPTLQPMTWNCSPYLGLLACALIALALPRREVRVLTIVFLVFLLLSLGDLTAVLPLLLKLVPQLGAFRYPSKYLLPVALAGALLAAKGLAAVRTEVRSRRNFLVIGGTLLGFSLLGSFFVALRGASLDAWVERVSSGWMAYISPDAPSLSTLLLHSSLFAAVPLALGLLIVAAIPRRAAGLAALIVFDLFVAASFQVFVGPRMLLPGIEGPVKTTLGKQAASATLCVDRGISSLRPILSDDDNHEWSQVLIMRLLGCPNIGVCDGLRLGTPYSPLLTPARDQLREAVDTGFPSGAFASGCTHIVTTQSLPESWAKPLAFSSSHATLLDFSKVARLYAVVDPLADGFGIKNPLLFSNSEDLLHSLSGVSEKNGLIRIIDDPRGNLPPTTRLPAGTGLNSVRVSRLTPSRIRLEVSGHGSAIVGVKTIFALGWRASQAGRDLPVLRVAGAQTGVWIEDLSAGPVLLWYLPPLFEIALAFSAMGLILIFTLALGTRGAPAHRSPKRA